MSPRQNTAISFAKRLLLFVVIGTASIVLIKAIYALGPTQAESGQERILRTREEEPIPVAVNQLTREGGIIPVQVSCENPRVVGGTLEKLSCTLKNNSSKAITAAGIRVTITLEQNGKESRDSGLLAVDSLWQAEVPEKRNLIPPNAEYRLEDLPSDYGDAVVKGIEIHLDYVEFDDQESLGPDSGTLRIITETRMGAAKYKEWLTKQLDKAGGSVEAMLPLLEKYQRLPAELEQEGGNQQEGANRYRSYIRRIFMTKGSEGVRKQLRTTSTAASK